MTRFIRNSPHGSSAGISMVEILLTVVLIGVIATVSTLALSRVNESTQHRKLDSDVQTLNSAIQLYLANGGDLSGLSQPGEILRKLKSSRSKSDKRLHTGAPSGRMIDARVSTAPVEADSWKARAVYNAGAKRFEIVSGQAGVEFILDDALAEVRPDLEKRSPGAMNFAENSGWVWDHTATINPNAPAGPSSFPINPDVEDSNPADEEEVPDPPGGGSGGDGDDDDTDDPPTAPTPPRLPTPRFSKNSGAHPEDDFPLSVSITNVPSAADAEVIYRLGSDVWMPYSGPISVPMNSSLRAQFISIAPSSYRDSRQRYAYYYPVPESLSGTVDGNFHSPSGGPNLVYEISSGDDHFAHGDPVYILDGEPVDSGAPNSLDFAAQSFSDIPPGQKFKLGSLTYHNGNSYYDSHATRVNLGINMALPERGENIFFDLDFDLVNTENDPDDPAASADYVRITNLQQNISLTINGVGYKIILEFGSTDSFGFSSSSQFHVYEGATGTGELLGTIVPK